MRNTSTLLFVLLLVTLSIVSAVNAEEPEMVLEGIFGLSDVNETTSLAFWVPLGQGEAVSGVTWFNNDGEVVFPELLAVAGDPDSPDFLANATVVGNQVSGGSLEWSQFEFAQPLATDAEGIYLIWRLPAGSVYQEAGSNGGSGFGFLSGHQDNRCWVTDDGEVWDSFTIDHQMAMVAEMNSDKSTDVLFLLHPQSGGLEEAEGNEEAPAIVVGNLVASPNPFNPSTTIQFTLPMAGQTGVSVFDLRGRLVKQLHNSPLAEGTHSVHWDGNTAGGAGASSGVYFVRVASDDFRETISITLTK